MVDAQTSAREGYSPPQHASSVWEISNTFDVTHHLSCGKSKLPALSEYEAAPLRVQVEAPAHDPARIAGKGGSP